MKCIVCGHASKVFDSRPTGNSIRRRRECLACGYRFTTYEIVAAAADDARSGPRLGRCLLVDEEALREVVARSVSRMQADIMREAKAISSEVENTAAEGVT